MQNRLVRWPEVILEVFNLEFTYDHIRDSQVDQWVKNPPATQETWVQSQVGKILWSRKWQPLHWSGISLQYSCLENFTNRGAWWATVQGVSKSWPWLSDLPHTLLIAITLLWITCPGLTYLITRSLYLLTTPTHLWKPLICSLTMSSFFHFCFVFIFHIKVLLYDICLTSTYFT